MKKNNNFNTKINNLVDDLKDKVDNLNMDPKTLIYVANRILYENGLYRGITPDKVRCYDIWQISQYLGVCDEAGKPDIKATRAILHNIGIRTGLSTAEESYGLYTKNFVGYDLGVAIMAKQWLLKYKYPDELIDIDGTLRKIHYEIGLDFHCAAY